MAIEPTVWRFLLFLGSEVLFLAATAAGFYLLGAVIFKKSALKNSYIFIMALTANILMPLFLVLFTWVLTGEGHLWLFGVIAVVSILLLLLVELLWLVFGGTDVPWLGRVIWAKYEFKNAVPAVEKTLEIISALALVAYPVYIGIGYFGEAFTGGDWPRYVLRATLILLFGTGWLVQLPRELYALSSRNIMEGTRSRLFMAQLGQSAMWLVLLAVFVWAIGRPGVTAPVLGEYFVFSSTIGWILAAYVVLLVLIPYLVGHHRTKHWVRHLEDERDELLDATSRGLGSVSLEKATESLDESESRIRSRLDALQSEESMQLATRVLDRDEPQFFVYRLALVDGLKRDPRFLHQGRLEGIIEVIDDCRAELAKKDQEKEQREVLKAATAVLEKEKAKEAYTAGESKAWVLIGLTTVATAIANPILSAVGKFITARLGLGQ